MSTRAKKADKTTKAVTTRKPAPVAKPLDASDKKRVRAQLALLPSANAAAVVGAYGGPLALGEQQDFETLMHSLSADSSRMSAGNMKCVEAMLYGQANALQSIFMNFSRRALAQEYQSHLESFLRMALKAQNQCRMTLETLATVKNPPVVFARQANINNGGQQQVNNGTAQPNSRPAHAANPAAAQNELLEASDGERLDIGATRAASGADPHMETVAAVHRPANE